MPKILVTGVAGFIFSNFIRQQINKYPNYQFVGIDKLIAPYNFHNLYEHPNYKFYIGDIADEHFMRNVFQIERPDYVINGAAESFVDASIASAKPFIHSNVVGVQCIVDLCVEFQVKKLILISTDEIFGHLQLNDPSWTEESIANPRNPYSASKLAGELIVRAAGETHGLNYNITRCSNNFGTRQPYRNLVPIVITNLLQNKPINIHGNGKNIREWIYVLSHCDAIMKILESGANKETYNIGSGFELSNLGMLEFISNYLNIKPVINFVKDRPGHDFRYSINCDKIKSLGWMDKYPFELSMKTTIDWYINNIELYFQKDN